MNRRVERRPSRAEWERRRAWARLVADLEARLAEVLPRHLATQRPVSETLRDAATTLSAVFRGYSARVQYGNTRRAVLTMQTAVRRFIAVRRFSNVQASVVSVQRIVRGFIARRSVRRSLAARRIQAVFRGARVRWGLKLKRGVRV